MKALSELETVCQNPLEYAREWEKSQKKPVIGYFCSYVPVEIIWAAQALPFRIFPLNQVNCLKAEQHLQTYCCGVAKDYLEAGLNNKFSFIHSFVFSHTCDTMQRLSDIWRMNINGPGHLDLLFPTKLNSDSAYDYYLKILKKFIQDLEKKLQMEIPENALQRSIQVYNLLRLKIKKLAEIKQSNPEILSNLKWHQVQKASMILDPETAVHKLDLLIHELKSKTTASSPAKAKNQIKILLSGSLCPQNEIYSSLDELKANLVWEDLCTGNRALEIQLRPDQAPLQSLAKAYMNKPICPSKHSGLWTRAEHILEKVRELDAKGVLFLFFKFCDPNFFDFPYLKKLLEDQGLYCLLYEIQENAFSSEQFNTRVQAFLEVLDYQGA